MNKFAKSASLFCLVVSMTACSKDSESIPESPPAMDAPAGFKILNDIKGYLDKDDQVDTVLVLQPENNEQAPVDAVVFSGPSEVARSQTVLSADLAHSEFTELQISNHRLQIKTFDGNKVTASFYQFLNDKFTLTRIEQSLSDAEAEDEYPLSFDLVNSVIEESNKTPVAYKFDDVDFSTADPQYIAKLATETLISEYFTNRRVANKSKLIPPTYKQIADASGDLNADGVADLALALQKFDDQQAEIKTLIYSGKSDVDFQLVSESTLVIPPKTMGDDLPEYESISLSINNQQLEVGVFKTTSNIRSYFALLDHSFRLIKIDSYATGAGGQSVATLDLIKSTLTQTEINTMQESLPEETKQTSVSFPDLYFQTVDPEKIIAQAVKGMPQETITGVLVSGLGFDNYSIHIRKTNGEEIQVYCGECGDWFSQAEDREGEELKESLKSKRVSAVIATEANNGRLAGPSDDEEFLFLKDLKFLN